MGNQKKIAISVLALIIIIILSVTLAPKDGGLPVGAKPELTKVELSFKQELLTLVEQEKALAKEPLPQKTWGFKNPFDTSAVIVKEIPVVAKPIIPFADSQVVLQGIIWKGAKPSAVINDKVVGIDGTVGGFWVVKEILADGVILSDGMQDALLKLPE